MRIVGKLKIPLQLVEPLHRNNDLQQLLLLLQVVNLETYYAVVAINCHKDCYSICFAIFYRLKYISY